MRRGRRWRVVAARCAGVGISGRRPVGDGSRWRRARQSKVDDGGRCASPPAFQEAPESDHIADRRLRWRDKKPQLLPEGTPIVSALGRPVRDGDSWLFVFEGRQGEPSHPPMPLLRNTWLEVLVPDDPTVDEGEMFILSGEVTTYRNRNYLLANVPMRASRQGRPEAVAAAVPSGDPLSERSADEVLKIMQAAAPETPVVWGPSSQALPVIGRPGRLIRDDTWWTFVFESDHPEHAEPRLRILPSQLLEMMADQVEAGATGLVFVVSGDVTEYRGDRYLLTRSAMGRPEMGNLSK